MSISISKNQPLNHSGVLLQRRATPIFTLVVGSLAMLSQPGLSIAGDPTETNVKFIQASVQHSNLQNTLWWQVAKQHQIDPYVLYAVALVESRKHGEQNHVTPWPWAINNAGKSFAPQNQQEAEVLLNRILDEGKRNVDVGIMQINLRWHGHRVAKPEHLLDPKTNLEIGARLLAEAIQSAPNNLALGVGRYYSWKNVPAAVEYGRQVIALADQIRTLI